MRKISMRDNYTSYIKLERKAVALENEQNHIRSANLVKRTAIKYGLQYGFNGLCSLILVFISIYYRYTPVIVFDSRYNFTPFGGLMAFPCGVQNGVSIPFWIVTSSFANKVLASYVKQQSINALLHQISSYIKMVSFQSIK